ncbi:phosphoadenosine phosphosulfate reductase, partial [Enterococcus faecium]|nr:phosphoadenosine phosphosulfate reductase [Enterococcus faecium]
IFLLETLGLYSPLLMNHYYRKICILFAYYKNKYNMDIQDMPDESKRKDWIKDERLWNDWKGIAKALEKNDFVLSTRNYSLTKKDEAELYEMFKEYKDFLGINQLKGKRYENIVQKIGGMK